MSLQVVGCSLLTSSPLSTHRRLDLNVRLINACFRGDLERSICLLESGAEPNGRVHVEKLGNLPGFSNWFGSGPYLTPLVAVAAGQPVPGDRPRYSSIARALIARGADVNLDDGYGGTAVYHVMTGGREKGEVKAFIQILLDSGATLDSGIGPVIGGPAGFTPLHVAARQPDLLRMLVSHASNLDPKTSYGDTPLHWAVEGRSIEATQILIEAGAKVNEPNHTGRRPRYSVSRPGVERWVKEWGGIPADTPRWITEEVINDLYKKNHGLDKILAAAGGVP